MTDNLSNFLLARIAEDEEAARAAILTRYGQTGEWVAFDDKEHLSKTTVFAWNGAEHNKIGQVCETEMSWIGRPARDHIARHDPARVLAECQAKRRVVELHRTDTTDSDWSACAVCLYEQPCETLRLLTEPYASHTEYDPGWRL